MLKKLSCLILLGLIVSSTHSAGGWLESSKPFSGFPNSEIIWHTGGNLGIGAEPTSHPGHVFQLSNSISHSFAMLENYNDSGYTNGLVMRKTNGGSHGVFSKTVENDVLGKLAFLGSTDSDFTLGAEVRVVQKGAGGSYGVPTLVEFMTINDAGSDLNRHQLSLSPSGNVAVGAEPSAFPGHRLQLSNIDNHSALVISNFNNAGYTNGIIMQKSKSGVQDVLGSTGEGDPLGFIHFKGNDSSTYKLGSAIDVFQKGATGSFGVPSLMTLKTVNSSGSAWNENQLVLSQSGNIGVGLDNPVEKLQVDGGIDTYFSVTGDNKTYVNLGRADSNAGILALYQENELKIRLDPRTTNNKSSFINAGNFGLGTNSPQDKLHVDGGIDTFLSVTGDNKTYVKLGRADSNAGVLALYQENDLKIRLDPRTTNNKSSFINSGNFGLGTDSPQYKLHVDGGNTSSNSDHARIGKNSRFLDFGIRGTNHGLSLQAKDANGPADVFHMLLNPDGGNVSIGTSIESTHALDVNGVVNAADLRINNISLKDSLVEISRNNSTITHLINDGHQTSTKLAQHTTDIQNIQNSLSQTSSNVSNIQANLNQINSDMFYNTNAVQTIGDATQNIAQENGNTGIGTSNPNQKLDVNGNIHASKSIIASEDIVAKKYIKVGLTSDYPPAYDCAEFDHYGRMKVDPYTPSLFICTKYGWMRR